MINENDFKITKTSRPEAIAQPVKGMTKADKVAKVAHVSIEGQTNHESNDRHVSKGAKKAPKDTASTSNNN